MIDLEAHGLLRPASLPAITLGPPSIAQVLAPMVEGAPDRVVLVGRSGRFTSTSLDEAVDRTAQAMLGLGVGPGDRIAASLPNDTPIVVAFLAAMRVGAIWVGINRALAPPEKAYMLRDSQTSLLLGDAAMVAEVRAHAGELPDLQHGVAVVPGAADDEWGALVDGADGGPPGIPVDRFAPAAIAYTSGTTGFPKGAVHTQHNLLLPGAVNRARRGEVLGGVQGVALPLTILNLMVLGPLLAYQSDMALVAMDRIDSLGMAEWIAAEQITTFAAVPAMVHDLLTNPAVNDEMLASLEGIGVGGADMPDGFRRLYEKRFGRRVGTGYGLTEAPTSVTAEDPMDPEVPGTCGSALPQVRIVIVDEQDRPVGPGEVGEVCVGPALEGALADVYRPMLGYWNRPEETASALRGGLLHTGDVGVLDENGNLFIKDRKHDLIIRGGANVYPAEIERVLHDDPRVAACAVVGLPDERLGERVVAFVELMPGATVTEEDLVSRCTAHLARYKVPEQFVVVDGFERTPMGKIRKTVLRQRLEHERTEGASR